MTERVFALPDTPQPGTTPAGQWWTEAARTEITEVIQQIPDAAWYGLAGVIVCAGLISSTRLALAKRTSARRVKSDKLLTFLAAAVATGVVATGMWKFFGDVLNIHNPYARVALFAFFEIAMLASAFRSRRFRLDRAAKREADPTHVENRIDVDGIAVWVLAALSGLFAAADENTTAGKAVRVVAPLLAAWMWERGLAGELMQFTRGAKRLNLRITPERVLVWLGIAEPSGRQIGEVDRKRRVAQFARTAYRLNTLIEQDGPQWRVSWLRWRLRRLTEAANEHLRLATDAQLLGEVRAQLALLYGVEQGTSRSAVADLTPLTPPVRRALSDRPHVLTVDAQPGSQTARTDVITSEVRSEANGSQSPSPVNALAAKPAEKAAEFAAANGAEKPTEKPAAKPAAPTKALAHPLANDANESIRALARAYAKNPAKTNAELAELAKVSVGTANRYMPQIRAAAVDSANADADEERAQGVLNNLPIREPSKPALAGVNGSQFKPEEN
ncbi:MAG: hypothetical protein ABW022_11450 [Actinoplanes sp.]